MTTNSELIFHNFGSVLLVVLITWLTNRLTLRLNVVNSLTEIFLSWILVLVSSPVLVSSLILVIFSRFIVAIGLRVEYGNKIFLAHPFDALWAFEKPGSTSTCVALYICEGQGDLEKVRKFWNARIMNLEVNGEQIYERFRWSLRCFYAFTCWERLPKFDINDHIRHLSKQNETNKLWTEEELFAELEAIQETSLASKNLSPWEILVLPGYDYAYGEPGKQYYAFVARMHHTLMDGVSVGHALYHFADKPFKFAIDPTAPGFSDKKYFPAPTLTGPKKLTWTRPIQLSAVQELKKLTKTSLVSIFLACLGGTMRKLFVKHNLKVPERIYCAPALALLPYADKKPVNRFSFVMHPVNIGEMTVLTRLKSIYKHSMDLAATSQIFSNFYLIYLFGLNPSSVINVLRHLSHATLLLSNMPGPVDKVTLMNGDELMEYGLWGPIKNTTGIGTSVFSYGNRLRVAIVSDAATLPNRTDTQFLCDIFEEEISELANIFGISQDKLFIQMTNDKIEE